MKKYGWAFLFVCLGAVANAQRSDYSLPYSFAFPHLTAPDNEMLISEPEEQIAAIRESLSEEKYFDFGVAVSVSGHNMLSAGERFVLPEGKICVRQLFYAPGAYGLNFNFKRFSPGKTGKLWVYSADKKMVLGAFDFRSVTPDIPFATAPVKGERVYMEFVYDTADTNVSVELAEVVYEFEDVFSVSRGFGSSGACNINVNCPEYADKETAKRSVAMILTQNNVRWCSGALVNNTAQDGKPYFLTAKHCNTTANSIFMFNYESPGCISVDGPTNQTLQGCTILADWSISDVTLVELSSVPPPNYFAYFSGWNAKNQPSDSVFGIHHPRLDVKKISTSDSYTQSASYYSGDTTLSHWRVAVWDAGTTEPGSSGSPLFDNDRRIVGQLHGGQASCANSKNDYYGKLSYSWEGDGNPFTSVKQWLDPSNTGLAVMDGGAFNVPDYLYDLSVVGISGADSIYCKNTATLIASIRNEGAATVNGFVARLYKNGIFQSEKQVNQAISYANILSVTFDEISVDEGENVFGVSVSLLSPYEDENPSNDSIEKRIVKIGGEDVRVTFQYDLFSTETRWGIYDMNGTPVYEAPPASAHDLLIKDFCLPTGCYFFRVTDSGKDGICCSGGEGYFSVIGSGGNSIISNEQFLDKYEAKFCVPSLPEDWDKLFLLYPNPTNALLNIKVQSYAEGYDAEFTIMSVEGKVLYNMKGNLKYFNTFDVSEWAKGIYFVRLRVGKLKSVQKFIKN